MATPKTNETAKQDETTTPKDGTLGNNTNPEEGESTEPNMTSPGTAPQEKTTAGTGSGEDKETVKKCTHTFLPTATLRQAGPSRLSIAATIAAGMLGQGRYTALLRDDRMVQDLAANSLRVADALIAADSETQA